MPKAAKRSTAAGKRASRGTTSAAAKPRPTAPRRSGRASTQAATRSSQPESGQSSSCLAPGVPPNLPTTIEQDPPASGAQLLTQLMDMVREQVRAEIRIQTTQGETGQGGEASSSAGTTPAANHTSPPVGLGLLPPPASLISIPLLSQTLCTDPFSLVQSSMPSSTMITTPSSLAGPISTCQPLQSTSTPHSGMVISPSAAPFPRKLVEKVKSKQFVEMKELLADNISLVQQLEAVHNTISVHQLGINRPHLREVKSLASWCYCFIGYMAILTSDPVTRDQLAYARLIIRQAQQYGGFGWLDYDRAFRQQAAVDPNTRWNTLNDGLQAATVLCQRSDPRTQFCTLCRGVDHTRPHCALLYLHPLNTREATSLSKEGPSSFSPRPRRANICLSWNRGPCSFPGLCVYSHVCSICRQDHKARDCPRNSQQYRQPFSRPAPLPTQPYPQQQGVRLV